MYGREFIPVGGVRGVKPVVSIIQGVHRVLPYVLLDSDKSGVGYGNNLKSEFYKDNDLKVLHVAKYITDVDSAEIEDLIPRELLLDSFSRLFHTEEELTEALINKSKSIVPQLEEFANNNDVDLELGWKVELSKKVKQRFKKDSIDQKYLKIWTKLFSDLVDG